MSQKNQSSDAKAKVVKKAGDEEVKKRAKADHTGFHTYINKILKNLHPEMGVTKNGMEVMNSFAKDMLESLVLESSDLKRYQKVDTISVNHVMGAIKLKLPPGLAEACINAGNQALSSYQKFQKDHPPASAK